MNIFKKIIVLSTIGIGVCHAGTVPCNGFKIDFKNSTHQNIVIDGIHFDGANVTTTDSLNMESKKKAVFTVNQSQENGVMRGEFLFHTTANPAKELKVDFSLTNKALICEVGNFSKQGSLDANLHRVLGGMFLSIKD